MVPLPNRKAIEEDQSYANGVGRWLRNARKRGAADGLSVEAHKAQPEAFAKAKGAGAHSSK